MLTHQVEFLIEGYLLPPTIGELRVSDRMLLEQVWRKGVESRLSHEPADYAIAYVGIVTPKDSNYFPAVRDYLDFFLLIYSLVSGHAVTSTMGMGTTLDNMKSLGAKRVTFPSFEKVHVIGETMDGPFSKPILDAKARFLQLLPHRQGIMDSSLGLALTYYYLAVRAGRRRFDQAVIDLMIAGEALLILKDETIRGPLSSRLSTLIAENRKEKIEISKKMRELYDLRSDIVHGRGKRPSRNDVRTSFNYVRRAIESGLSLKHLSKKELVEKLDRAKVGR